MEEKRKLYAPDSAPIAPAKDAVPKNPYAKSAKPFNAWADKLVAEDGFPTVPSAAAARKDGANGKKRAAEDGDAVDEREILYDGVKFTARRTGGEGGSIEIVDEDKVGKGEGQWPTGKVFRFVIAKKDGSTSGDKEDGARFEFGPFKSRLEPVARPAFVSLTEARPIAALPGSDKEMKEAAPEPKAEFPTKLTAPPMVASASDAKKDEGEKAPAASGSGAQQYPAKGQASFKDVVSDEQLEKLKQEVAEVDGRKVEWERLSGAL